MKQKLSDFLPLVLILNNFLSQTVLLFSLQYKVSMLKNNKAKKPAQQKVNSKETNKPESKQSKLQKLVKENSSFEFIENGKIKCILTGHEFAPTLQNFEAYIKSKSYKKGIQGQFDISQYQDFLVPFKGNSHFLFCRLTGVKLPKKKTALERHIKSKKFQYRMQKVLADNEEQEAQEDQLVEQAEQDEEEQQEEEQEQEIEESVEEQKAKPKNGKQHKKGKK